LEGGNPELFGCWGEYRLDNPCWGSAEPYVDLNGNADGYAELREVSGAARTTFLSPSDPDFTTYPINSVMAWTWFFEAGYYLENSGNTDLHADLRFDYHLDVEALSGRETGDDFARASAYASFLADGEDEVLSEEFSLIADTREDKLGGVLVGHYLFRLLLDPGQTFSFGLITEVFGYAQARAIAPPSPVPLPAALLLLTGGLGLLAAFGYCVRRTAALPASYTASGDTTDRGERFRDGKVGGADGIRTRGQQPCRPHINGETRPDRGPDIASLTDRGLKFGP
jgi:hypothetical protein